MYVVAYETGQVIQNFLLDHALSIDIVCNRRLFSMSSKVEMAEEQEHLGVYKVLWAQWYSQVQNHEEPCHVMTTIWKWPSVQ